METFFITLLIISPIIIVLTSLITHNFSTLVNWEKEYIVFKRVIKPSQALTWVIAILFAFLVRFLGISMVASLSPLWTVAFGWSSAFVANGIYDVKIVKTSLIWILNLIFKKKRILTE
jgi:hypothetical protein